MGRRQPRRQIGEVRSSDVTGLDKLADEQASWAWMQPWQLSTNLFAAPDSTGHLEIQSPALCHNTMQCCPDASIHHARLASAPPQLGQPMHAWSHAALGTDLPLTTGCVGSQAAWSVDNKTSNANISSNEQELNRRHLNRTHVVTKAINVLDNDDVKYPSRPSEGQPRKKVTEKKKGSTYQSSSPRAASWNRRPPLRY